MAFEDCDDWWYWAYSSIPYYGEAVTGKTFSFNAVKEQVNRCFGKKAAKVCVQTGVAARLVGERTIHSTFKLPVEKDGKVGSTVPPLTGNYLRTLRRESENIEFLFIDEISMTPYQMLSMMESRWRQLNNSDELFDNLNVIVCGDLSQLPPIPPGTPIYKQPARYFPAVHLWRTFSLAELMENMRQHLDLLLSKQLTEATGVSQVEDRNNAVLNEYSAAGTQIFKILAKDVLLCAQRNVDNVNIDKIVPKDDNKIGGLLKELEIFVGARVMLRANINVTVCIDFDRDGIHIIEPRHLH
ncbi:ATP-dependent DNA helicase PIF1-like [Diabrotica virgifera virgifera]|uniref:ATP-dependent DNA helicase n=1 Tax=Diabrotica virgifera virgifera TaxID=50390 RepID=A0ABM5L8Z6_DIAVI|nr:ATP-dependent DNA helicase PIF1-like [Diabrotica virgifera virgifera]